MASILVVGANRGIGLALVEEIRATQPDATIYATTRSPSDELNAVAKGSEGHIVVLEGVETTDTEALKTAAEELSKHTKTLDIIYNNSGVSNMKGPIAQETPDNMKWHFDINVVGPHNVFVAFAPFVLASKAERRAVIVTSSALGSVGSIPAVSAMFKSNGIAERSDPAYAVSKAGVNMLGRFWGESLEPQGVSVLLMHPGIVATRMAEGVPGAISPKASAEGIVNLVATFDPAQTSKGIHAYDGAVYGW